MSSPENLLRNVLQLTNEANEWRRKKSINLIASENVMSPLAEAVYLSDFMSRYAEGKPKKRYYQGTKYIDELEIMLAELMGKILNIQYIETRPISGTIANASVFKELGEPGDRALVAPVQAGSHVSHTKFGTLGALGMTQVYLPYDEERMNVDVDKAIKMIKEEKFKFLVLGGSVYLFPHPVKELADAVKERGAKIVYDAAHVFGLMVGGVWRNPLREGADVMTASTHKTFPGPQGGLIAFSDEGLYKQVSKTIFPYFLSNHHLHRIPATLVTTLEMMKYGEQYAKAVVENAKKFAEALAEEGFKVLGENLGYTMSHQVVVDVAKQGGGAKCATLLESANIITNKNLLPYDPPENVQNPSGLRLGTQEMTRYGMGKQEMYEIAHLMRRLLIDNEDPEKVKKDVIELRSGFLEVKYGFTLEDAGDLKDKILILR
ncbi:MAG: serine hydroxymethyltransferase [Fervidicoccus fontis]|uniref:Serine hydroxymethyltransferase n=1 Tax=Fervidicoccus fontis TaxID=683846 RepID=A0A2J6N3S3_9CREN|nr:MAG: serine hydroxymethyltransferase [Fervidicoccus fontis]PMB77742.1 MAG: serine hydroxymethyltransferase [Fervidicoccus fontis]